MLLLVVLVVALASVAGPARAYWRQRSQLAALRADIATRQTDVAGLRHQVTRWNDPAYVKAQARSRLHLVMPGETGYVVVQAPRPSPSGSPSPTGSASPSAAGHLGAVSGATNPLGAVNPLASASPTPTAATPR